MVDHGRRRDGLDLAEYALEAPLACHHCGKEISAVQVVRLLRTKVNFISTLPRRGHVIVCPECNGILSADLGGMT
jgi:DNA-directed RNA polymerase subunit RPC12/RpoP